MDFDELVQYYISCKVYKGLQLFHMSKFIIKIIRIQKYKLISKYKNYNI